jgi:hypothetical protein
MGAAMNLMLVKAALGGNVTAFREVRDLAGEAGPAPENAVLDKARAMLAEVDSAF